MCASCPGIHLSMMIILAGWRTLEAARVLSDDDTVDDDDAAVDDTGDDNDDDDDTGEDDDAADGDTGEDDAGDDPGDDDADDADFRELENIGGSEGPRRTNQQLVAPLLPLATTSQFLERGVQNI